MACMYICITCKWFLLALLSAACLHSPLQSHKNVSECYLKIFMLAVTSGSGWLTESAILKLPKFLFGLNLGDKSLFIVICWFVACMDEPYRRGAWCWMGQYNVCYKQCWLVIEYCIDLHVLYDYIFMCNCVNYELFCVSEFIPNNCKEGPPTTWIKVKGASHHDLAL